jgi:class 3 adenylate cyclase/pimeloyl-ACP methyl ester carboxylesterase
MSGMRTEFGYARAGDGAYIGYRVDGDGPIDLVWQPDWPGGISREFDDPYAKRLLGELSSFARVISHDHRGVGVSSRNVALPSLETRVDDLFRVLDKIGANHPVLLGWMASGGVNVLTAATRPDLARAIVWLEPMARYAWAPDYPWGETWEALDNELALLADWGTERYTIAFKEQQEAVGNPLPQSWIDMMTQRTRDACTPDVARDLARIWYDTDVRGVLASVRVPTLLLVHQARLDGVRQAEHVAALMPDAVVHAMEGGADWSVEEVPAWVDEIRQFVGLERPRPSLDTILSTVLFTDIVDSTKKQAELGDSRWKELVLAHHAIVRAGLEHWRGVENDTAGDGFYATFEGPARAIRCAVEVTERVRDLGIEVRAGVHTGECEVIENKCGGLTVSIGARVASNAGPSQVLVSQTVKDLVAGSGLTFEDAGKHELKGVPDRWRLYRVVS